MIRPHPRHAAFPLAFLLLGTGCGPAAIAPVPAGPATGSIRVTVAPARTLQTVVDRHLPAEVDHYRATLSRREGREETALPGAAGTPEGDEDDIFFSGLADGTYRVEVTGLDAADAPVTTAESAIVTLAAGAGATATVAPTMVSRTFAGKVRMPAVPGWVASYTLTLDPLDDAVAGATYDASGAGTPGFDNLPVGTYDLTYSASDGAGATDEHRVRFSFDPDALSLETDHTADLVFGAGPASATVSSEAIDTEGNTLNGLAGTAGGAVAYGMDGRKIYYRTGSDPFTVVATADTALLPGLCFDAEGSLYFVDDTVLKRRTTGGAVEAYATLSGTLPRLPAHKDGTIYLFEEGNNGTLLKVEAGTPPQVSAMDLTDLGDVRSFTILPDGFFVFGYADGSIVRRSADGLFAETLVSAGRFGTYMQVTSDAGGVIYFCGLGDHAVYQIDLAGDVSRVAGTNYVSGAASGRGDLATFGDLRAIAMKGSVRMVYDALAGTLRSM